MTNDECPTNAPPNETRRTNDQTRPTDAVFPLRHWWGIRHSQVGFTPADSVGISGRLTDDNTGPTARRGSGFGETARSGRGESHAPFRGLGAVLRPDGRRAGVGRDRRRPGQARREAGAGVP